ncbi:MAG: hypothetical protein OXI24_01065, partial [Candidatus Poribacteria bacterium]|nr:hypothetical protein [Candidatus Poribacteria bacterium]
MPYLDLLLEFLAQNSDQVREIFVVLFILFGLCAFALFVRGCIKTWQYRNGLCAMERWERSNPDFNIDEKIEQAPEIIRSARHPLAFRWLEHFEALY